MSADGPQLRELMCRVERLERQNRWLKRAGLAVVAAVGAVLLMGQAAPVPKVVEAQKFVLKDSEGHKRAELSMQQGRPSLRLYDSAGVERVTLAGARAQVRNSAVLTLNDSDGRPRTAISEDGMGLLDANGQTLALLDTVDGVPTLQLSAPRTNRPDLDAFLSVSSYGPQLRLDDRQGYTTIIGSTELVTPKTGETHHTSAASIVMLGNGKNHKVIWQAPQP